MRCLFDLSQFYWLLVFRTREALTVSNSHNVCLHVEKRMEGNYDVQACNEKPVVFYPPFHEMNIISTFYKLVLCNDYMRESKMSNGLMYL